MATGPIVREAGDGEHNTAFGLPRLIKVRAEDTGGQFSVWEETVPGDAGPPLHVHHGQYELFAVLEGRLRFVCNDTTTELSAGGLILIPPGAPHTFKGLAEAGSRCLLTLSPGRGVGFFVDVEREQLNPGEHMDRIVEIARDYDLEFVGPPLD